MRPRVIRGRGGLCPGLPQSIVSGGTYLHFCYCHNITKPTQYQTCEVFDASVNSRAIRITKYFKQKQMFLSRLLLAYY